VRTSRKLRRERETSLYGDEETGTPPDELYFREDAEEALEMVEYTFNGVSKLLSEYSSRVREKDFL